MPPGQTQGTLLAEIKSQLAQVEERQKAMREMQEDMLENIKEIVRALRGKNGETGLIAVVQEHDKTLQSVKTRLEEMAKADKDFAEAKRIMEENPPLTWLLRFKTKATVQTILLVLFMAMWLMRHYGSEIAQWIGF